MADFYIDASKLPAGDYGAAWAGTATGTSGSTTLTINSNTSGVLTTGAFITGTGIPADTYIVSGSGGPPFTSVVLSRALTSSPSAVSMSANGCMVAAGTVPTKAEDGNGKGTGTASMATLVITLTGIPAAGGTITIAGVTFTARASGATGNEFNAVTDATTCATNLKNAINASTTNIVNPTPAQTTAPLRNVVNATSSAGVVTVYTRIGGTEWNSVTETESLTNAVITTQWSGGADGAWAHMFNLGAIGWPTSVATSTYGGMSGSYLGSPQPGDVLHVRTARSGADIILDVSSIGTTGLPRQMGSAASFVEIRFDNGSIWSGDNGVFTIRKSDARASNFIFQLVTTTGVGSFIFWRGQMQAGTSVQSGGQVNFKLATSGNFSVYSMKLAFKSGSGTTANLGYACVVEGLELLDGNTSASLATTHAVAHGLGVAPTRFTNCKFAHMTYSTPLVALDNTFGGHVVMTDCLFVYGNYTATAALFDPQTTPFSLKLIRPKFSGGNGGQHVLVPWASADNVSSVLIIEDPVDMGGFIPTASSAGNCCGTVAAWSGGSTPNGDMGIGTFLTSNKADRAFLIDIPRKLLEWRAAGFPTTGLSVLPDSTPYSARFSVAPTAVVGGVSAFYPQHGIRQVVVNTLGDNNLTLTHRFLLDASYGGSTYTPAAGEFWIEGTYVSSADGSTKTFSTRTTAPADDSATTWTTEVAGVPTYAPFAGGARTYSKWKATVNLTGVEANTEVVCYLVCAKAPSAQNQWCFIDPQFQLVVT